MSSAIGTLQRLAREHPSSTLPCPMCSAVLKAENVEGHLRRVHPDELGARAGESVPRFTGRDRRVRRLFIALNVAWFVCFLAAVSLESHLTHAALVLAALTFAACFVPLVLALFDVFRAHLELRPDGIRLRFAFGLVTREVRFPVTITSGRLVERRTEAGSAQLEHAPTEEVNAGNYLALSSGSKQLVLGCVRGGGLGGRWASDGWQRGPKKRGWDITLERSALLAVEYELAARGYLRPRAG